MSEKHPFRSPFDDARPHFRSAHFEQRISALAILSLLCGLMSVPMMCLCFTSVPFSLAAIVMGHMSRGIVRDTNGTYRGIEMATFGTILGYSTLLITGITLLFYLNSESTLKQSSAPRPAQASTVLLQQAEAQLLSQSEEVAFGVSTSESSAQSLAQHYIDALHVLDSTHFSESATDEELPPRAYRAFVQLNSDSVAFLLFVPEYARFTDEARQTLIDSCWLIAQRSVDGIVPNDSKLAVALYSDSNCQQIMIGKTARGESSSTGLSSPDASRKALSPFFRLAEKPTKETPSAESTESASEIKRKPLDELPAEVESL